MKYRLVRRVQPGIRAVAFTFASLSELLDWCSARWPAVDWAMKPASLLLALIEAESRYEYEVEEVAGR